MSVLSRGHTVALPQALFGLRLFPPRLVFAAEWKALPWAPLQVQCHSCSLVQWQESSGVYSLELVLCVDGVQGILGPLHEVLVCFPVTSPKVSRTPDAATFPAFQFTEASSVQVKRL